MSKCIIVFLAAMLTGCSFSVSIANTQGEASDVIDDNSSNTPNLSTPVF